MSNLDHDKADILSTTPKVITENVIWNLESHGYKLRVRVIAPEVKEVLELRGVIGKTKRSFTLLFENQPIRRYCNRGQHRTHEGLVINGPHKHTWDQIYGDAPAYIPNDIDPQADPNDQLLQFLSEQNITLEASYQRIMFKV